MSLRTSRRYRQLLFYSRIALFWEMLWPKLWPAAAILGVFVSLALLDVFLLLPGWLHALVLTLFLVSVVACVVFACRGLPRVTHAMVRRHLENNSAPGHRPLTAIEDQQAAGVQNPVSRMLWQLHLARASVDANHVQAAWPAPDMARREPWGIRAGVILLLAIAIVAAGGDAPQRLLNAVSPGVASNTAPPLAEVWITPPAYTGQPPLFLSNRDDGGFLSGHSGEPAERADSDTIVNVPQGSLALVRAAHVSQAPQLVVGSKHFGLSSVSSAENGAIPTFSTKVTIEEGQQLSIRSGREIIADWNMRVIPDLPPTVAFVKPPETAAGSLLSLSFEADDDYQVREVSAIIRRLDQDGETRDGQEIREPMPLTSVESPSVDGVAQIDLTFHPWAGQPVSVVLQAIDALGQTGTSVVVEAVLPERVFNHPVARAVIAERKKLFQPSDITRKAVAGALKRISETPDHFAGDIVVSLGLSVVRSRLTYDQSENAVQSSSDILWQLALRLEEGDVPVAERALQDARQALWEALRDNAPIAEIERLIEALTRALDRYLAAVSAEMARRGDPQALSEEAAALLQTTDPQDLIDLMREFAQAGARDSARQLLAELQRMLQGLRAGLSVDSMPQDVLAAKALAESIHNLARQQQQLLDQTFQRLRSKASSRPRAQLDTPGDANDQSSTGANQQKHVRAELVEIMKRANEVLGNIPRSLDTADQSMTHAIEALQDSRASDALANQTTALEALNHAIDHVNGVLAQRLSRLLGVKGSNPEEFEDGPADLFGGSGADGTGGFGHGSLKIPDKRSLKRAHQIIEELRRKAGEGHRTRIELDYFDRLLRQF